MLMKQIEGYRQQSELNKKVVDDLSKKLETKNQEIKVIELETRKLKYQVDNTTMKDQTERTQLKETKLANEQLKE